MKLSEFNERKSKLEALAESLKEEIWALNDECKVNNIEVKESMNGLLDNIESMELGE